jgi:hypothetical protein
MHFLIFMDGLRADVLWIIWAMMLGLPVYLIWAPKIARGWHKNVMRVAGTLLAIVFVCASLVLSVGILMGADPPREHKGLLNCLERLVSSPASDQRSCRKRDFEGRQRESNVTR